jgi:hypothetical protein
MTLAQVMWRKKEGDIYALRRTCRRNTCNTVGVAPVRYSLGKSATTPNVRQKSGLWGKQCYYKRTETTSRCADYITGSVNRKGVHTLITLQHCNSDEFEVDPALMSLR